MSTTITIGSQIIDFPSSAEEQNWATPVIEFAEAVEAALEGLAGAYDVSPQILDLTSDINSATDVPLLTFPTTNVRGAYVKYSLYRDSDTTTEVEAGELTAIYNNTLGTWSMSREATGTTNNLTLSITNAGQIQFATTAIGGTYAEGTLSYQATALLQDV